MKRNYFVFIQAFLITVVVFIVGFYVGISVEGGRLNQINSYYTQSETSLVDILALNSMVKAKSVSCSELVESNKDLLNKVYEEATLLGQYEESGKLTNNLKDLHTKYDVLRTYLWINSINIRKECPKTNFSTIVYLYTHDEQDLTKRAEQNVWSKLLLEIKNGNSGVLLIPIAQDSNSTSLDALTRKYNITSYPAVIVDQNKVFTSIPERSEIEKYVQ